MTRIVQISPRFDSSHMASRTLSLEETHDGTDRPSRNKLSFTERSPDYFISVPVLQRLSIKFVTV